LDIAAHGDWPRYGVQASTSGTLSIDSGARQRITTDSSDSTSFWIGSEYSGIKSISKKERLNIMTGSGIEVDADQPTIVHDYDNDRQVLLTAEDLIAYQPPVCASSYRMWPRNPHSMRSAPDHRHRPALNDICLEKITQTFLLNHLKHVLFHGFRATAGARL